MKSCKRIALNTNVIIRDVKTIVPYKTSGSKLNPKEKAEFKVIEFNKDSKRIVLSHSQTYNKKEEEPPKPTKKKKAKTKEKVDSKNTLGDANEKLKELKDKMDGK